MSLVQEPIMPSMHNLLPSLLWQTRVKQVGLLHGAGTRFASWFYAMMRLLRLKEPLKSTIHQQKFPSARAAVKDIGDEKLWKCMYILLHSVYPALRALRYCDSSKPSMDKIFFLSQDNTSN